MIGFESRPHPSKESRLKICIIDDEKSIVKLFKEVFERKLNAETFGFYNGEDTVNFLAEHGKEIDIILSDYMLQDTDGCALREKVKQFLKEDVKYYVISGVPLKCSKFGPNVTCLQKPIDLHELIDLLKNN